eukprot:CAMPEP_0204843858 /NCGR_PEP_ID=MMETSP1346-20131115/48229_1 /ASSEMBLY_ACC=CAM_ASM_000771 /TAXON_ID=215587 /ORGANISM="Aplanochytrium stocchinoi, Strain GSBS06" /LENGTH=657 /DNA_ID=CAMNT_0051983079 /DNA_START=124 /DNA_END=2094 /DNA_ORIENTATION=+
MAVPYHQQAEIEALIAGDKKRAKEFADQDPDQVAGETRNILRKVKGYDESKGKVIKKILKDGEGYRTPLKNADVEIHYKLGFVSDITTDGGTECANPDEESELESEYIFSSKDTGKSFRFELMNNQVNEGLDICVKSMKKGEICEVACTGIYGLESGINSLLPGDLIKSENVSRYIEKGATLKFEIELLSFIPQLDIHKDKGVIKRVIKPATNLNGLGWPHDNDEIVISVVLEEGHLDGDEKDLGKFTFYLTKPTNTIKAVLPPGVLDAVHEIKITETAEVVIAPVEVIGEKYAPLEFREQNNLSPSSRLVYRIQTLKINKVREVEALGKKIKYKILNEGVEDTIDTPKLHQFVMLRVKAYAFTNVDRDYEVEPEKEVLFFLGDAPSEDGNLDDDFEHLCLSHGELPIAVESVILKMKPQQRVIVYADAADVFGTPDADLFSSSRGVSSDKVSALRDDKNKKLEFDVELVWFEEFPDHHRLKPMARIDRMLEYKEAGTMYFKCGAFEKAKELYMAGSDVYSRYNYWGMDDRAHQAKVRPHKVTLMLNAGEYFCLKQIKNRSDFCFSLVDIASCHMRLKEYAEAITLCNDAIKIDENYPKGYLRRASAYISYDEWEKAKKDLLKVKELDPKTPGLRHEIERLQKKEAWCQGEAEKEIW